jgi:DNA-binding FrmR family transcriptional regulator
MTSRTPPDDKKRLLNRLRRLEGQVRGLERMIQEDRPCLEVLTLLAGVRSALNATGDLVLERYLTDCLAAPPDTVQPRALIEAMRLAKRST